MDVVILVLILTGNIVNYCYNCDNIAVDKIFVNNISYDFYQKSHKITWLWSIEIIEFLSIPLNFEYKGSLNKMSTSLSIL